RMAAGLGHTAGHDQPKDHRQRDDPDQHAPRRRVNRFGWPLVGLLALVALLAHGPFLRLLHDGVAPGVAEPSIRMILPWPESNAQAYRPSSSIGTAARRAVAVAVAGGGGGGGRRPESGLSKILT